MYVWRRARSPITFASRFFVSKTFYVFTSALPHFREDGASASSNNVLKFPHAAQHPSTVFSREAPTSCERCNTASFGVVLVAAIGQFEHQILIN